MKTLLACIAILFAVCFICCSNTSKEEIPTYYIGTLDTGVRIHSCTIKGHKYLIYGSYRGGITHDETCHCRK